MMKDNLTPEVWAPIPGYEGLYEVSTLGRVRSRDRVVHRTRCGTNYTSLRPGRVLKQNIFNTGRPYVELCKDNIKSKQTIHRLMLMAFVGPAPEGMVACHNNDVPTDNSLENLRWDTQLNNMADLVRNGKHHEARRTHCDSGHEYTPDNTNYTNTGKRVCKACKSRWAKTYYASESPEKREARLLANRERKARRAQTVEAKAA